MSIGFKEWTLVCDALGSGAQSIIIRKGGIAEGRAGFRFEHPEFFLFPTLFHEQVTKLKLPPDAALPGPLDLLGQALAQHLYLVLLSSDDYVRKPRLVHWFHQGLGGWQQAPRLQEQQQQEQQQELG